MSLHLKETALVLLITLRLTAAAELLLVNGRVWTGDGAAAEAVVIEGKRIVGVGTAEKMRVAFPEARTVDLKGRFLMPGFNDAHIHFLGGSQRLSEVDLTGVCELEKMQKFIGDYAAAHPEAKWIRGGGWEYGCFPGARLPLREDLDAVVKDRPVYLSAYDGHTGWANSAGLAAAGITKDTKFEAFGEVVHDAKTGEPTGCLKEGAQALMRRVMPVRTHYELIAALEAGMKLAASLGITSLHNASGDDAEVKLYEELRDRGRLTLRVGIALSVPVTTKAADVERYAGYARKYAGPLLTVGAVKFVLDGVIESHTAAMLDLYSDGTKNSGTLAWDVEYRDMVARMDAAGLHILTHAIGDRAVRTALDAYENALQVNGAHDARYRIEHIETISGRDMPRFAKLRVLASMEPIHADPGTSAVWSRAIGAERASRGFAWHSLEAAGARLVFSSDWPASISLNPIRGIHNAVNRETVDGEPKGGWIPAERVSVETALRGYTTNAAYAEFADKEKGVIRAGALADLVVLDQDPFRIARQKLHALRVEMTIFDGRVVYER